MASPLAGQLGCAFDDGPFGPVIRTDAWKESTVPGVYAAGDAARVLEVIAGVLLIGAAVLLPVGLIAVLAAYAGRLVVRRRRERALEMA
jgi:thioredoxin reductase